MNYRTTLVLLLLLMLAGGGYWYVVSQTPDDPVTGRLGGGDAAGMLLGVERLSAADVVSIEVKRGQAIERFERTQGAWRRVAPAPFPLDAFAVQQFIDEAAMLRHEEKLAARTISAEDAGLAEPRAVVTFTVRRNGQTITHGLRLGKPLGLGGRAYMQVEGDPAIYVASDRLHQRIIDDKLLDLRTRRFTAPAPGQVRRITQTRGGETIVLERSDDAGWRFAAPLSGRADDQAVGSLLSAIAEVYVTDFVSDAAADLPVYGLDEPAVVLHVALNDGGQRVLRVGAAVDLTQESHFATWSDDDSPSPVVFRITSLVTDKLAVNADALRDPHVTAVAAEEVTAIHVTRVGQPPLSLIRSDGGWAFDDPAPEFEADANIADGFLQLMMQARAEEFVPDAAPVSEPRATLTLVTSAGDEVIRVYAAETADHELVLGDSETVGYLVPARALRPLFSPPLDFRRRVVLEVPQAKAVALRFERPDGEAYQFTRDDAGAWRLEGEASFEDRALHLLLPHLYPLRAARWVSDPPPITQAITVTMTVEDVGSVVLRVDAETGVGELSGDAGAVIGFLLSDELLDLLEAEYLIRHTGDE